MCFLKCTLQEGVPEFPLYNIKGKHGEMDADMDAGAAPWRYASLSRIKRGKGPSSGASGRATGESVSLELYAGRVLASRATMMEKTFGGISGCTLAPKIDT